MRVGSAIGVGACALLVATCAKLPASGPHHRDISEAASESLTLDRASVVVDYVMVDISQSVLQYLQTIGPESFFRTFGTGRGAAPELRLGIGDVVAVSIFESSSGGLFVPSEAGSRPGNFVTLPPQAVDANGNINVPFAGKIRAANRSIAQVQSEIESYLAKRAIEPQVVIALTEQRASEVAVFGDATGGLKEKIAPAGDRVLDVIAKAGLKYPGYEVFVTLQRKKTRATVFFPLLIKNPTENIYVQPGDVLYVYRQPQTFVAVGALGSSEETQDVSGKFDFDADFLSLAEAIGKAGGLLDTRAGDRHVFLYRLEEREVLEKIGMNLSRFDPKQILIPTVYRASSHDPSFFFATDQFPMRHKDIIYVANADAVEINKFLSFVTLITGTVSGVATDALITRNALTALGN